MIALVALGSNLGDRHAHLEAGLAALAELGKVTPSPLVMDTPDEYGRGPAYLNTVAKIETEEGDARCLLEALLRLELRLGRNRKKGRNAPRTIDLDLIRAEGWKGTWTWPTPKDLKVLGPWLTLELPHPRAAGRAFVMEPLKAMGAVLEDQPGVMRLNASSPRECTQPEGLGGEGL